MKLEKCNNDVDIIEYRCSLTKELDILSGLSKKEHYDMFYHYILTDEGFKKEKCLAIRVPGGTVGSIHYDDNNIITNINIDTGYVIETYPDNVNELLQKYIGEEIEWKGTWNFAFIVRERKDINGLVFNCVDYSSSCTNIGIMVSFSS